MLINKEIKTLNRQIEQKNKPNTTIKRTATKQVPCELLKFIKLNFYF